MQIKNQNMLPVDVASEKVQDSWEDVMQSLGHMHDQTDYVPQKNSGEGYYTLKSNSADEAADVKWEPVAPLEDLVLFSLRLSVIFITLVL